MRKILLLSVSAGAGHMRAAQALAAYAEKMEGIYKENKRTVL